MLLALKNANTDSTPYRFLQWMSIMSLLGFKYVVVDFFYSWNDGSLFRECSLDVFGRENSWILNLTGFMVWF